jgi:subtilisin family serine protease
MTPTDDDLEEMARQRTRDQYALLKEVHGDSIIVDTDDEADFNFICSSEHVLVPGVPSDTDPDNHPEDFPDDFPDDPVNRLRAWFGRRTSDYGPVPDTPRQERMGLVRRFPLPTRLNSAPDGKDLLATLAEMDGDPELGEGFATPDHLVHICGKGLICPATEPNVTGDTLPYPSTADDGEAGAGVEVVVIDTGWYDPTAGPQPTAANLPWGWLTDVTGEPEYLGVYEQPAAGVLYPYAGHGTFVAGVVRAMAPACRVHVLNLEVDQNVHGGGVLEADLVDRLYDALRDMIWLPEADRPDEHVWPDLISMSAGCPTRLDLDLLSFVEWHRDVESRKADLVLVAAAGNNSTPVGFWPASFSWATGVGSLDRDGSLSDFSNFGSSVDVLAVGRDVINAFPNGTYVCREGSDKGKNRYFTNNMAVWSGTSFSTPLVTGLIAAEMSRQPASRSATRARDDVLNAASVKLPVDGGRLVPVVPS